MVTRRAAAAEADSEKKRKRGKIEDAGRSKKRRPQENGKDEKEAHDQLKPTAENGGVLTASKKAPAPRPASTWTLSEPMGGTMAAIDPIYTTDEQHLIIVYRNSIQIYSAADSLLERRIKLPEDGRRATYIVAAALSPESHRKLWVACADGSLFKADRKSGSIERIARKQQDEAPPQLVGMTVELVRFAAGSREVLYLSEGYPGTWTVTAYDAASLATAAGHTLFTAPASSAGAIELLRTTEGGEFITGTSGELVFVGGRASQALTSLADLSYRFFSLDAADEIACLDVRTTQKMRRQAFDLVVGCVRGAIYVYGDIVHRLQGAATAGTQKKKSVRPRKYHWHTRCVNAVKWSRDGNYFISGGRECVLVVWQVETGRLTFLPHLAASIENIVVSPRGSSYAIHLDDNSAMLLSTAELTPTFYVSGLQSLTLAQTPLNDVNVRRVWQPVEAITKPVPAVVDPTDASQVWLRVGSGQKASMTGEVPSASQLQIFDVTSFGSVVKQPLARTNPTEANTTPRGQPVTEPTVTHLCTSRDGKWLASVDEWQPPVRDISGIPGEPSLKDEWARERREVHLKFWARGEKSAGNNGEAGNGKIKCKSEAKGELDDQEHDSNGSSNSADEQTAFELVTRIDEAHFTSRAETIFAVAADSQRASRFATLGDDAVVRFWGVRARVRDGLVAKDGAGRPLVSWHCVQAVPLPLGGEGDISAAVTTREQRTARTRRNGALAFSEDGSTVFAAFGGPDAEAVLYTIDAESGRVRGALQGLFRGFIRGVEVLGSTLVLLSEDLRVYDIVADELRYGIRLLDNIAAADVGAASALTQVAVGRPANTFVVAVPYKLGPASPASTSAAASTAVSTPAPASATAQPPTRFASRLLVFSPDHAQPLFAKSLPKLVVSLLPSVRLSGFLAIDSAAQMWSIADAADTTLLGQSLADLHLPATEASAAVVTAEAGDVAATSADKDMEDADVDGEDEEDDEEAEGDDDVYGAEDAHDVVIAPQKLREIFDAAPATAANSVEELFWQVSGLLTGLPSVVRAG